MKKCPFCAEEIQDAAIVCKHCHRDLAPSKAATIACPFCKALVARDSKVCPACGDDISGTAGASPVVSQAQAPAPKKKTSLGTWAVLILIGLGVVGWLSSSTAPTTTPTAQTTAAVSSPPPAPTPAPAKNTAAAESARAAVAVMMKQGLIKRMDVATGKFYIYGDLWDGFELDAKQNIVKVISGYRETEYKGLPQVTLYESRSGKELANYGAFSGVTIR